MVGGHAPQAQLAHSATSPRMPSISGSPRNPPGHPVVAPPVPMASPVGLNPMAPGGSGAFPSSRPVAVASPVGSFAPPIWHAQAPTYAPSPRSSSAGFEVQVSRVAPEVKPRWESTGVRVVGASLSTEAASGTRETSAASGSTQLAIAPSGGSIAASAGDAQVGALRNEIEGLRAELDVLKTLLDEGVHQREETERNQSALITRVEQLSNYKIQADQQVREAQAETQWLRQELARRKRQDVAPTPTELDRPMAPSSPKSKPSLRHSSSWSPPLGQKSNPPSPSRRSGPPSNGKAPGNGGDRAVPSSMSRSSSFKPHPPVTGMDEVDEMWRSLLQRFPQFPHWCLVKEKRCVYRMGSQSGKKVVCRVSPGGLQVRVGGGWMAALPFLERYGPVHMGPRCGEDPQFFHSTNVDLPASMERLLVPTKSWAQRIGIRKTPDLREQRRLQEPLEARQSWSRCAPPSANCAMAGPGPAPYAAPMPDPSVPQAVPETEKQVLQPLVPWPGDKRNTTAHPRCEPGM